MTPIRTIIMGAAGRDFHNFNVFFRDNSNYRVVAFTATQIPNIEGRRYPAELAGSLYPEGISIFPESDLERLIKEQQVDQVVTGFDGPDFEAVAGEELVDQGGGGDEAEPEHEADAEAGEGGDADSHQAAHGVHH